jgi:hypothetical protein
MSFKTPYLNIIINNVLNHSNLVLKAFNYPNELFSNQLKTNNMELTQLQKANNIAVEIYRCEKKLSDAKKSDRITQIYFRTDGQDHSIDITFMDFEVIKKSVVYCYEKELKKLKAEFAKL